MVSCTISVPPSMPNPGQSTISPGAMGDVVRRLQRALRRTPNLGLTINGTFDSQTETAVKEFQQGAGLVVDGIVGPLTWNALPDGGPMPTLQQGSTGDVVRSLQTVLTNGQPVSGSQRRKESTATLGRIHEHRWRRFSPGAVLQWTGLSVTRPGQFRCMQLVPLWSPQSVSISSSINHACW